MSHFDYVTHTARKIQFTPSTEIGGDGACGFRIEFDKEEIKNVKDFLDEVLLNKEYFICGSISIVNGTRYFYSVIDYSSGNIKKQKDNFAQFAVLPIKGVRASGGWGRMDFDIEVE